MRNLLVLALVNFMWATQFSGAKIATAQLGPITVTFLTLAISTLLLAPFLRFGTRGARAGNSRPAGFAGRVLPFLLLGTLGSLAAQLCLTWGVQRSLASNASVLQLSIPVLMALLAAVLLRERMTGIRWISFALAIAGVLMVSDVDWRSVDLLRSKYLAGNVLIFLSCWGSAFYNVYSKKLLRWFGPVQVLVYSFLVSDAVLLPLMLKYEPVRWSTMASLDPATWISLGMIAVVSLSLSMVLFLWVLERVDVTQASLSIYLLPVFGVLISAFTVKEKITLQLLAGGTLVLLGTILITIYEEKTRNDNEINALASN